MTRVRPLTIVLAAATAVAAMTVSSAGAAPRTVVRSYTANAPVPSPAGCGMVPDSYDVYALTLPARATLAVTITDFVGDWDLALVDKQGTQVAFGGTGAMGAPNDPKPDRLDFRPKTSGRYSIVACNWAGGSSARVTYTLTY